MILHDICIAGSRDQTPCGWVERIDPIHANISTDTDNACDSTNETVLSTAELCCFSHSVN